jgi:cytochrome c oxidase assembly protein subunit 15
MGVTAMPPEPTTTEPATVDPAAVPATGAEQGAAPVSGVEPAASPWADWWYRLRDAPRLVTALCLATLVGNAVIVVTGSAVRLTGSGLGCPTWPSCTDDSYVTTSALGIHGFVEFGNRMLTFALSTVIGLTIAATLIQRHRRRALVALAGAQLLGIVGQAVLGGITVLTGLNPWTVAAHFLLSMVLIYAAYALWQRSREGDGPRRFLVPGPLVWLARALVAAAAAVLAAGTVVTGSGPHSGDRAAARTGFDPAMVSQLHADAVFLLLGLTIAAWLALRAVHAPPALARAAAVLLAVELAQGAVGFVQYFTHLPVLAVGLHVLGACGVWIAALAVLFGVRTRPGPVSGRRGG